MARSSEAVERSRLAAHQQPASRWCLASGQSARKAPALHTRLWCTPACAAPVCCTQRTWAGTHTIHSALSESQISARYLSAADDRG